MANWPVRILGAAIALSAVLLSDAGHAQQSVVGVLNADQIFEISGIKVDATAVNANVARDAALASGQKRAFNALMVRVTQRADRHRIPAVTAAQLAELIQDFEVLEEKTSAVRYLATLSYHFNATRVRGLLREYAIPFAETPSKQLLVLPVFQRAGAMSLWDDPNPWREAWDRIPSGHGLVPLILPLGDLADIAALGVEQAANGDQNRLSAIAARYGATDTLVATATVYQNQARGTIDVETVVTRYGSAQVEQTLVLTFSGKTVEGLTQILQSAALGIAQQVEDNWKRDNLIKFRDPRVVAMAAPIAALHDWVSIRKKLNMIAVVTDVDLVLMSRREVRVNLHYLGNFQQLQLALSQQDLVLHGTQDNWILLKAGVAPPEMPVDETTDQSDPLSAEQ